MTSSRSTPEAVLRRRSSTIPPKVLSRTIYNSGSGQQSRYSINLLTDDVPSSAAAAYDLGVHNTLKPLKLAKQRGRGAIAMASPGNLEADSDEHVLPGGVGTFSIRQVPSSAQSRGEAASHGAARGAFAPGLHGSRTEGAHAAESGARPAHSGPSAMWQDSGTDQRSRSKHGFAPSSSGVLSQLHSVFQRLTSALLFSAAREGRSSGSSADQGPTTPRSKHSATEQRRRTKINDRQAR